MGHPLLLDTGEVKFLIKCLELKQKGWNLKTQLVRLVSDIFSFNTK